MTDRASTIKADLSVSWMPSCPADSPPKATPVSAATFRATLDSPARTSLPRDTVSATMEVVLIRSHRREIPTTSFVWEVAVVVPTVLRMLCP